MNQIRFTDESIADMVRRYRDNESLRTIAKAYDVVPNTIKRVLRDEGVQLRRRGAPGLTPSQLLQR